MNNNNHIVVLEDDPDLRELFTECLQGSGYIVSSFERFSKAKRHLQNHRCDLILVDMQLPDVLGKEIIDKLRSDSTFSKNKSSKIIILSGQQIQENDPYLALVQGVLLKPVSFNALVSKVEKVIGPAEQQIAA